MTTINLLPPEIRQKRAAERRTLALIAGAIVVLAGLVGVYVFFSFLVSGEQSKLAQLESQNAATKKAIAEYQIFEKQKAEVAAKKATVQQAIAGEIPWYRLLNEISLVIPSEVWLITFQGDQATGALFTAQALDRAGDTPDTGHKPVAKWMVRLSEIPMLTDVWLTSSTKGEATVQFQTTAKVKPPASSSVAPAPPSASPAPSTGG